MSSSRLRSLKASIISFCAASNAAVEGHWPSALSSFAAMLWNTIRSNAVALDAACSAASSIRAWRCASRWMVEGRMAEVQCNAIHFSHAVAASETQWQHAAGLLEGMKHQHLASKITRNNALSVFAESSSANSLWHRVLQHLDFGSSLGNVVACGTALVACEAAGKWRKALWLCHALPHAVLHPNNVMFGALCSGLRGRWYLSLDILKHVQSLRLGNAHINSCVLTSCVKAGRWQMALDLGCDWQDVVISSACISACEKGKDWGRGLQILQQLRGLHLSPSPVSYGAAINACEACEEWQAAMLLLRDMWADRLQATVVTLNGVIQACQKCSRWKETLLLLDEMCCSKIDPNLVTFNGVLAACSQSRAWQETLGLFLQLVEVDTVSLNSAISAASLAACGKDTKKDRSLEFCNHLQMQLADKGVEVLATAWGQQAHLKLVKKVCPMSSCGLLCWYIKDDHQQLYHDDNHHQQHYQHHQKQNSSSITCRLLNWDVQRLFSSMPFWNLPLIVFVLAVPGWQGCQAKSSMSSSISRSQLKMLRSFLNWTKLVESPFVV